MPNPEAVRQAIAWRVVPVVVIHDSAQAAPLAAALARGGLPVAEVTLRTPAAPAAIAAMARGGDVLVGAGSVTGLAQAEAAARAGAEFAVSPGLSRGVVERCEQLGLGLIPGVATATEVQAALELGLDLLKFFPAAQAGGPAALAALGGPFGQVRFVPTGGVGPANLASYLALPQVAAVGGSWMVPAEAVAAGDWDRITHLAAEARALADGAGPREELAKAR